MIMQTFYLFEFDVIKPKGSLLQQLTSNSVWSLSLNLTISCMHGDVSYFPAVRFIAKDDEIRWLIRVIRGIAFRFLQVFKWFIVYALDAEDFPVVAFKQHPSFDI